MTYPFKCRTCGTEFDIHMSVKKYESIVVYCPICKAKNPSRVFYSQGISIQFKDSGFTKYVKEEK